MKPSLGATTRAAWLRSPALTAAVLLLLALAPRALGLADFLTTDEAYHWITRVERFSAAVAEGRWAATVLTGHPGVTNMWLGSLGLWLERTLLAAGVIAPPSPVEHLAWLRLPGATLQSLLVPAAYLLLRRRIDPLAALIAALLWACSPYLLAHSRLLHLDALLTSFVTFSVLLLCEDQGRRTKDQNQKADIIRADATGGSDARPWSVVRGPWSVVSSGIFAGLALLTKGPALILLPFAGLLLFAQALAAGRGAWPARVLAALRHSLLVYAIWLGAALLTALLLWPALWAAPEAALGRYIGEIVSNGGRPNGDGQFFLGRAVDDPGPLFYPLASLLRTTPLMLAGLLCAAGLALWDRRPRARVRTERSALNTQNVTLWALLALALFWTLVMTLGPKKFDRYVLPVWPALLILAASGLAEAWRRLTEDRRPKTEDRRPKTEDREAGMALRETMPAMRPRVLGSWFFVLLVAAELWQPLAAHPYYLSYYNPALGGGPAAERSLLIGWGEGMDQAGAWLSARPDIGYGPVLSALGRTLQPFVPVDVRDVEDFGRVPANYAVVYLESVQRAANPPLYAELQRTVPLHRVAINGIEYARIYQLPRPFATPLAAQFGEGLRLHGYTLDRAPGRLTLTPSWDVRAPLGVDALAFVHLLDAQGRRVAELAVAPGGGDAPPTGAWQPGQQIAVPLPLDLPPDLPPGEYMLTLGLFDPATGARLPLTEGRAADPQIAGDSALLIATLQLP